MSLHFIELLYTFAAILSISVCVPQLGSLIKAKRSEELNLTTWAVWTLTQTITLVYVMSIGNVLMAFVTAAWVSFYAAMVGLIIHYRYNPAPLAVIETSEA